MIWEKGEKGENQMNEPETLGDESFSGWIGLVTWFLLVG